MPKAPPRQAEAYAHDQPPEPHDYWSRLIDLTAAEASDAGGGASVRTEGAEASPVAEGRKTQEAPKKAPPAKAVRQADKRR